MNPSPPSRGPDALGDLIGIEHLESGDGTARARVEDTDRILQPQGLVHGGIYPVLAEAMCSRATLRAVAGEGKAALGQSNNATFLRPISEGYVNAAADARHRGRSGWVWQVEITVAVRERPSRGTGS